MRVFLLMPVRQFWHPFTPLVISIIIGKVDMLKFPTPSYLGLETLFAQSIRRMLINILYDIRLVCSPTPSWTIGWNAGDNGNRARMIFGWCFSLCHADAPLPYPSLSVECMSVPSSLSPSLSSRQNSLATGTVRLRNISRWAVRLAEPCLMRDRCQAAIRIVSAGLCSWVREW